MKSFPKVPPKASELWFLALSEGKCTPEVNKELKEKLNTSVGEQKRNQTKNRYSNILPYNSTRFILETNPKYRQQDDDYINANHLNFPPCPLNYIATQAPLPNTIVDFWCMVVQTRSPLILVLTKEMEGPKRKLHPYWPSGSGSSFKLENELVIEVVSEKKINNDLLVVKYRVLFKTDVIHETIQLRYEGWPDHGVPSDPEAFLSFLEVYRSELAISQREIGPVAGPPIIHCSAGVGRTGTFCAIDTALHLFTSWSMEADLVLEIVNRFRQQRIFTVQSYSQFCFIYLTISHYINNRSKEVQH